MSGGPVRIRYRRPPDRVQVFEQVLVARTDSAVVTLLEHTPLPRPMRIAGEVVLEDGSPVVWCTFPGLGHDIGRFHGADGRFTGFYANILTPVVFHAPREWETTDLFLDVWLGADGSVALLDEEELDGALNAGWIDAGTAAFARTEAARLLRLAASGEWPPEIVREWTLARARKAVQRRTPPPRAV